MKFAKELYDFIYFFIKFSYLYSRLQSVVCTKIFRRNVKDRSKSRVNRAYATGSKRVRRALE